MAVPKIQCQKTLYKYKLKNWHWKTAAGTSQGTGSQKARKARAFLWQPVRPLGKRKKKKQNKKEETAQWTK